jgi:hypothetical protein
MEKLKDVLREMLQYYRLTGRWQEERIRKAWTGLMGPVVTKYTRSLHVMDRKLIVRVDSAPLRQELSLNREHILQRINAHLGESAVDELIVR